jgi:WD40 repeat-containing protein SMU1
MEIKQSDLLQLLAQYLQEANLYNTLDALSKEADLKFNTVPSKLEIENMILDGLVVDLLERMKNWNLSDDCTLQVYILIFYQLLDDGEVDVAQNLLVNSVPLVGLRDSDPQFYLQLSEFTFVDPKVLVDQKKIVAKKVLQELEQASFRLNYKVSENRLLELIGQSLKWQIDQGLIDKDGEYDILRGEMKRAKEEKCLKINHCFKEIKVFVKLM